MSSQELPNIDFLSARRLVKDYLSTVISDKSSKARFINAIAKENGPELVHIGYQKDADAVLSVKWIDSKPYLILMVGLTAIAGRRIVDYLIKYYGGDNEKITAVMKDIEIKSSYMFIEFGKDSISVFKGENERWRAFRPDKNGSIPSLTDILG